MPNKAKPLADYTHWQTGTRTLGRTDTPTKCVARVASPLSIHPTDAHHPPTHPTTTQTANELLAMRVETLENFQGERALSWGRERERVRGGAAAKEREQWGQESRQGGGGGGQGDGKSGERNNFTASIATFMRLQIKLRVVRVR